MPFKNILVNTPALPSNRAERAMDAAERLAGAGSHVTVFDVASNLSWIKQYLTAGWEETFQDLSGTKRKQLKKFADSLCARGIDADSVEGAGRLSAAIIQQVNDQGHDLVVKVAEDKSTNRSGIVTSTDMRLIHSCSSAVLVLRPDAQPGFQNVAVAMDILDQHEKQRDLDDRCLSEAAAMIDPNTGSLAAIYALPDVEQMMEVPEAYREVVTESTVREWNEDLHRAAEEKLAAIVEMVDPVPVAKHILRGQPQEAIAEFVETNGIDLLVVGSVARQGLDGWLIGNTAERILERVPCSVLVLKPDAPMVE